jgi:hypothetical protein
MVGRHRLGIIAAASCHVGTRRPIATPMSACRSAGASLHAIAGHGDDFAGALIGAHQRELLGGADAGEGA